MSDEFARSMELLDELEQKAFTGLVRSALTAQERSLLLTRLMTVYATAAAEAGASATVQLSERELQIASRWFG